MIILGFAVVLFSAFTLVPAFDKTISDASALNSKTPPNIILFIGDGMGLSQVSASYYYKTSEPIFSDFPIVGLIKTSSSSHKITDSAAGATAFACGVKTYNGAIGLDSNERSTPNLTEVLAAKGYASALVATSSFTHATPASFFAHVTSRSKADKIAKQLGASTVDFVAGGGREYLNNRDKNPLNLIPSLEAQGFIVDTSNSLTAKKLNPSKKYLFALAKDGMPTIQDGRGDFLQTASAMAINYLRAKKKPFFLMVEGSQIDWGGHAKNADYLISELLDFERCLTDVLDFAKKQGNTLVVVCADHETGGFTLAAKKGDYNEIDPRFSTGGHSATLIPVFAFGPGANKFGGVYENTAIYTKILDASKVID